MSAISHQVVTPTVRDPNSVPETLANGPINMNVMGNFVTLTFTQVRPDVAQLFKGKVNIQDLAADVVVRVTMPVENLIQLKEMLAHPVFQAPLPGGSALKQ